MGRDLREAFDDWYESALELYELLSHHDGRLRAKLRLVQTFWSGCSPAVPPMASLKQGEVKRQLASKFGFEESAGSRHDRFVLKHGDEILATVDVKRSRVDFGDPLIGNMASQAGVRPNQFRQMIGCTWVDPSTSLSLELWRSPQDGRRSRRGLDPSSRPLGPGHRRHAAAMKGLHVAADPVSPAGARSSASV